MRPLQDRIVARMLPVSDEKASPILNAYAEKIDNNNSGARLEVVAVSTQVQSHGDIKPGDVVIVAKKVLLNMLRTRVFDGDECHILHESDIDGVEVQDA